LRFAICDPEGLALLLLILYGMNGKKSALEGNMAKPASQLENVMDSIPYY